MKSSRSVIAASALLLLALLGPGCGGGGFGPARGVSWILVSTQRGGTVLVVQPTVAPSSACDTLSARVSETPRVVTVELIQRSRECKGWVVDGSLPPLVYGRLKAPLAGRLVDGSQLVAGTDPTVKVPLGRQSLTALLVHAIPDATGLQLAQALETWPIFGVRPTVHGPRADNAVVVRQDPAGGSTLERTGVVPPVMFFTQERR